MPESWTFAKKDATPAANLHELDLQKTLKRVDASREKSALHAKTFRFLRDTSAESAFAKIVEPVASAKDFDDASEEDFNLDCAEFVTPESLKLAEMAAQRPEKDERRLVEALEGRIADLQQQLDAKLREDRLAAELLANPLKQSLNKATKEMFLLAGELQAARGQVKRLTEEKMRIVAAYKKEKETNLLLAAHVKNAHEEVEKWRMEAANIAASNAFLQQKNAFYEALMIRLPTGAGPDFEGDAFHDCPNSSDETTHKFRTEATPQTDDDAEEMFLTPRSRFATPRGTPRRQSTPVVTHDAVEDVTEQPLDVAFYTPRCKRVSFAPHADVVVYSATNAAEASQSSDASPSLFSEQMPAQMLAADDGCGSPLLRAQEASPFVQPGTLLDDEAETFLREKDFEQKIAGLAKENASLLAQIAAKDAELTRLAEATAAVEQTLEILADQNAALKAQIAAIERPSPAPTEALAALRADVIEMLHALVLRHCDEHDAIDAERLKLVEAHRATIAHFEAAEAAPDSTLKGAKHPVDMLHAAQRQTIALLNAEKAALERSVAALRLQLEDRDAPNIASLLDAVDTLRIGEQYARFEGDALQEKHAALATECLSLQAAAAADASTVEALYGHASSLQNEVAALHDRVARAEAALLEAQLCHENAAAKTATESHHCATLQQNRISQLEAQCAAERAAVQTLLESVRSKDDALERLRSSLDAALLRASVAAHAATSASIEAASEARDAARLRSAAQTATLEAQLTEATSRRATADASAAETEAERLRAENLSLACRVTALEARIACEALHEAQHEAAAVDEDFGSKNDEEMLEALLQTAARNVKTVAKFVHTRRPPPIGEVLAVVRRFLEKYMAAATAQLQFHVDASARRHAIIVQKVATLQHDVCVALCTLHSRIEQLSAADCHCKEAACQAAAAKDCDCKALEAQNSRLVAALHDVQKVCSDRETRLAFAEERSVAAAAAADSLRAAVAHKTADVASLGETVRVLRDVCTRQKECLRRCRANRQTEAATASAAEARFQRLLRAAAGKCLQLRQQTKHDALRIADLCTQKAYLHAIAREFDACDRTMTRLISECAAPCNGVKTVAKKQRGSAAAAAIRLRSAFRAALQAVRFLAKVRVFVAINDMGYGNR